MYTDLGDLGANILLVTPTCLQETPSAVRYVSQIIAVFSLVTTTFNAGATVNECSRELTIHFYLTAKSGLHDNFLNCLNFIYLFIYLFCRWPTALKQRDNHGPLQNTLNTTGWQKLISLAKEVNYDIELLKEDQEVFRVYSLTKIFVSVKSAYLLVDMGDSVLQPAGIKLCISEWRALLQAAQLLKNVDLKQHMAV